MYTLAKKIYRIWKRGRKMSNEKFQADMKLYNSLNTSSRFPINQSLLMPMLGDATEETGFDTHYIYHPAWAARIIKNIQPKEHIDISSTLAFCTMLSAFLPVKFYDYRPAKLNLSNLVTGRENLTQLSFDDDSIESLSCMHTLEHIGLGRYGDAVDPDGDLKAISELKRVTKPSGNLLVVVPVGKAKLEFNAHRIYNSKEFASYFSGFELKDFSLVDDDGKFIQNAKLSDADSQHYGCGCLWFQKKW